MHYSLDGPIDVQQVVFTAKLKYFSSVFGTPRAIEMVQRIYVLPIISIGEITEIVRAENTNSIIKLLINVFALKAIRSP